AVAAGGSGGRGPLAPRRRAGGSLEFRAGGGLALGVLESGIPRLEIVADRDGLVETAMRAVAGRHQHVVALVDAVEDVGDAAADALRRDAVLRIVLALLLAAAVGLSGGALHRARDGVGIGNHLAVDLAGGP